MGRTARDFGERGPGRHFTADAAIEPAIRLFEFAACNQTAKRLSRNPGVHQIARPQQWGLFEEGEGSRRLWRRLPFLRGTADGSL
jgi:hypothetical protein